MSIVKQIFLLLVLQLTFLSCESTDINSTDSNFSENFGAAVSRDFIGQVVDTDNHPIQSVTIKIGTTSVQTDVNGVFIINGASVYEKFAYITAKKTGYIDGSRAMVPTSGKNNVRIMLLQDAPLQTIQSGVTSEVSIYSGTKVVFDGAFMDENGAAYSGAVAVSMFHLTPSDENISKLMPGMLYAQNENGQEGVLETFGMMHVELRGTNGQKLQIATGHKAQITLRIDDSQLATCPSTIPLWHFDEQNGYWKQEGSATKNGNYYVGNVSHFSWWNCDAFSSLVTLTVTVHDSNGNPISNVGVSLSLNTFNSNSNVQLTDSNGQVSGLIPANQLITLNIQNECGEIIYTSQIPPSSTNINLQNIIIQNNSQTQSNTIKGILTKCDNSNVTNGYVIINYVNNSMIYNVTNGDFSFNLLKCNTNNFTLQGYDLDNIQTSNKLNYSFNPLTTNVGFLPTCSAIDEFVAFKVNNDPTQYIYGNIDTQNLVGNNQGYGSNSYIINFNITAIQGQSYMYIIGDSSQIGSYSQNGNTNFQFAFTKIIGSYSSNLGMTGSTNTNLIINKFEAVGGYIDVTFSGTGIEQNGQTLTLSGVAHVRRDF